jgi:hypothetical protein
MIQHVERYGQPFHPLYAAVFRKRHAANVHYPWLTVSSNDVVRPMPTSQGMHVTYLSHGAAAGQMGLRPDAAKGHEPFAYALRLRLHNSVLSPR